MRKETIYTKFMKLEFEIDESGEAAKLTYSPKHKDRAGPVGSVLNVKWPYMPEPKVASGTWMHCPSCDKERKCAVQPENGNRNYYYLKNSTVRFFKRLRECSYCYYCFSTAEVAQKELDGLVEDRMELWENTPPRLLEVPEQEKPRETAVIIPFPSRIE